MKNVILLYKIRAKKSLNYVTANTMSHEWCYNLCIIWSFLFLPRVIIAVEESEFYLPEKKKERKKDHY